LHSREIDGGPNERLTWAIEQLSEMLKGLDAAHQRIAAEVEADWDQVATQRAPGAMVLDAVMRRYGTRFVKESGRQR
jgi:hypothetical protein